MIINPRKVIEENWLQYPDWMDDDFKERCVQPNAVDITLDRVFTLENHYAFHISETTKIMRPRKMQHVNRDGAFELQPHSVVDVMSDFFVHIPTGVAAYLIIRSTFNRNGLFVTSGLYDTGFSGSIGAALHNRENFAYIHPHTRFAQIIFVESDSCKVYAGGYNTSQGQHWTQTTN